MYDFLFRKIDQLRAEKVAEIAAAQAALNVVKARVEQRRRNAQAQHPGHQK